MELDKKAIISLFSDDPEMCPKLAVLLEKWSEIFCVSIDLRLEPSPGLPRPDLILCALSSIDTQDPQFLRMLEYRRQGSAVILIGSEDSDQLSFYQLHPHAAFLLPLTREKLWTAMDHCAFAWKKGIRYLSLKQERSTLNVPLCDLLCVEAMGKKTLLHCAGRNLVSSSSLSSIREQLTSVCKISCFYQCQKSFLIHLDMIERLEQRMVFLKGYPHGISISRSLAPELRRLFEERQAELKL